MTLGPGDGFSIGQLGLLGDGFSIGSLGQLVSDVEAVVGGDGSSILFIRRSGRVRPVVDEEEDELALLLSLSAGARWT